MARPLVPIALIYACGLLAARLVMAPLWLLFAIAFAFTFFALILPRHRAALLWPIVFFAAWANFTAQTSVLSPFDLRRICPPAAQLATVRGELLETPVERIFHRENSDTTRTSARIRVSVLRRVEGGAFETATGVIQATLKGKPAGRHYRGQVIEVEGVLAPPPGPSAPGLFDYRAYLEQQGIYFQLQCHPGQDWRYISGPTTAPWTDRLLGWAQQTLARGLPEPDLPLKLLWAMTLGWETGLDTEVYEPFIKSGTMHIFAISGLHIALIAAILVGSLRVFQVPRAWCGLLVVPLIWLYTAVTGWQPSAIRSTIMMTVVICGWALRRPGDLINSLAGAAVIILLWDPQQLFGASFQLSFFVVLSLALFNPPLQRFLDRWLEPDEMLPHDLVARWRQLANWPLRVVLTLFATSLAAWLGSLPLTAHYFNLVSPITLAANMVVVPLSSAALACNLASLCCGSWFPALTELFNFSGWFWMDLMVRVSQMAAVVPGGCVNVEAPSLMTVMLYFALVLGAMAWGLEGPHRRRFWLSGLFLVAVWGGWQGYTGSRQAKVTLLPFEGGLGIYCEAPGGSGRVLIDPGTSNVVEYVTARYLRTAGVNICPTVVMTHGDAQHINGTELIFEQFRVRELVASPLRFRSPNYRKILDNHTQAPPRVRTVARGATVGPFRVLHPDSEDRVNRADEGALVLAGSILGTRILLLSDLGREGQEMLLRRGGDLRADIVVAGLPSVGEPLSAALLEEIKPRLIVIGDSEYPASARAAAEFRERMKRVPARVLYTSQSGALSVELSPGKWRLRQARREPSSPGHSSLNREQSTSPSTFLVRGDTGGGKL
jgi:ComEC/Rec2-related protein